MTLMYCTPSETVTIVFFFFNDTATTEIYTLSLHDALPIYTVALGPLGDVPYRLLREGVKRSFSETYLSAASASPRSEEHTSELQSRSDLVCRLLLEKKNKRILFQLY